MQALDEVRARITRGLRRRLRAGAAEPLQDQGDGAGRARGDSPDVDAVPPGDVRAHPDVRSVLPLSPDLEPVCRVADDAGGVRRHHRRHRGGGLHVPRQGLGAEVRRLAGRLRRVDDRSRRERTASSGRRRRKTPGQRRKTTSRRAACCRCCAEGQTLDVRELRPDQKFTQPPPRFNEGSLVKALEEDGIGRPSTYASIISVLQARDYVNKIEGRFRPTILGRRLVDKLLHPVFDDILDVEYTARMEEQLDDIEKGTGGLQGNARGLLQELREGPEARRQGDAQLQGRAADRCVEVRQVRPGRDGREGRQVRHLPRLQPLSRLRQHQGARAGRRADRGARRDVRELRPADGRQARPLRDVPRLHRLSRVQDDAGRSSRRSRASRRPSRIRFSTRRARTAARTSSSSRAGSASSPPARAIPSASTSS